MLPQTNLLLVDKVDLYGDIAPWYADPAARCVFEAVAEQESLELVWYDSRLDNTYIALNTADLPGISVADADAGPLLKILDDHRVPYITHPRNLNGWPGGGFNCCTNLISKAYVSKNFGSIDAFLEHVQLRKGETP